MYATMAPVVTAATFHNLAGNIAVRLLTQQKLNINDDACCILIDRVPILVQNLNVYIMTL